MSERPPSYDEILDALEAAELEIRMVLPRRGVAVARQRELTKIADVIRQMLVRAGRPPPRIRE